MIQWISSIFDAISSFFANVGQVIDHIVSQITLFFSYIQSAVQFVGNAFLLIPTYYVVFGAIIIAILIIFLVLGRNAGGD